MNFLGYLMEFTQSALSEMLQKNRGFLTAFAILACLFFVGIAVYLKRENRQASRALELIEKYENDSLEKYVKNKLSAPELQKKFQELLISSEGHRFLFSVMMKTARELSQNKEYSLALKVLLAGQEKFSKKNSAMFYFISMDLAVLYEELGSVDKAVSILEKMDQSTVPILKDKIYLDLGRLYHRLGDKEKARLSLNRLLANSKEDQFVDIGKIYLHLLDVP